MTSYQWILNLWVWVAGRNEDYVYSFLSCTLHFSLCTPVFHFSLCTLIFFQVFALSMFPPITRYMHILLVIWETLTPILCLVDFYSSLTLTLRKEDLIFVPHHHPGFFRDYVPFLHSTHLLLLRHSFPFAKLCLTGLHSLWTQRPCMNLLFTASSEPSIAPRIEN